jgi:hypothetical protein
LAHIAHKKGYWRCIGAGLAHFAHTKAYWRCIGAGLARLAAMPIIGAHCPKLFPDVGQPIEMDHFRTAVLYACL